jgi:tripartite-type tricarboxylate transporter receptor subunit TctC
MLMPRHLISIIPVGIIALNATLAIGQTYPSKPIRIVTSPAGSGIDLQSRLIAEGISGLLAQQVIVENRPAGFIPGEVVAKAAPDGYTLLCGTNLFMFGPLLQKAPYDPLTNFSPIAYTASAPNVVVVTPSLPVKSVSDLIALARARPGELNYSVTGIGGIAQLAVELFKSMARLNIVLVPYSSISAESTDLISGRVQLTIDSPTAVRPHIRNGKLRALAVTSLTPFSQFPDVPTMTASGVPGYEAINIYGIFAPANTPASIVSRLNQEIVRFLLTPEAKEKFLAAGQEVVGASGDELTAKMKSDSVKWAKVIKDAGIRTD